MTMRTVNVTVTTPGGTSNTVAYAYVAAPVLTTVTPNQGPLAGGSTVTLPGIHSSRGLTPRNRVAKTVDGAIESTRPTSTGSHPSTPDRQKSRSCAPVAANTSPGYASGPAGGTQPRAS